MRPAYLMATLFVFFALFLLSGCECTSEGDAELCGERTCGLAVLTDRCGDEREVSCGECGENEDCENNQCICPALDAASLCHGEGMQCGMQVVVDNCGEERQIHCGGCDSPETCVDGQCRCEVAETGSELCAAQGYQCGETVIVDSCGESRELNCGSCTSPEECTAEQICHCEPETDSQLCAQNPGTCGSAEIADSCNQTRQVDCQPCVTGSSTLGAVRDAESGALIDDAHIRVFTWPPPGGSHFSWFWPIGYRLGDADFSTTSTSGVGGEVNFEFAHADSLCLDDAASGGLQPQQIYRFHIERPGYTTQVFYRYNDDFSSHNCPDICPTSSSAGCFRLDFELWPDDTDHPLLPELFVDPRDLEDYEWQCAILPSTHTYDRLIGLRVRLGAANLGQGPFHLQGTPGSDGSGEVVQHIWWTDDSQETHVVDSGTFTYVPEHRHIHFLDWFRMSLVDPVDECRDVDDRASSCVLHTGTKISYCLHDLDPFDGDVIDIYGGHSPIFPDPPTCDTTEQGVTQGWKDTYSKDLPNQLIVLGTPSEASGLGQVWIEAEVDPHQVLMELSRDGNVARILIDAPADAEEICNSSATILDCSGPPAGYNTQQRRQCRNYVNYDD